jgi:large subunit ribosomal protein L9e
MKTIQANKVITVPDRVNVSLRGRVIKVTGPRGTLEKDFGHASLEMIKLSAKKIMIQIWFAGRKQTACVNTIASHIENLFKGVLYGYRYKMRAVYAHFPINVITSKGGSVVEIKNFLGQKRTREVSMRKGVTCSPTGNKDEIQVDGNDLELVSSSGELKINMPIHTYV